MHVRADVWAVDERVPAIEDFDEEYLAPRCTAADELASLSAHSLFLNNKPPPDPALLSAAKLRVEARYREASWKANLDWNSDAAIELILNHHLNQLSSPGEQINSLYSIIGEWLKAHEVVEADGRITHPQIVARVRQRIKDMQLETFKSRVRTFVKPELHKKKKILSNLHRLISSFDVVDLVVDHLLFTNSLLAERSNHERIPTKVGMPFCKGGWNANLKVFADKPVIDVDKSHWDWSVAEWELMADHDIRRNLCLNWDRMPEEYKTLFTLRYKHLLKVCFVTSSGNVYEQERPGAMKSGSLLTISANSRIQVLLRELYEGTQTTSEHKTPEKFDIIAMGDDSVETAPADLQKYETFLRDLGHEPKRFVSGRLKDGVVSFCSQTTRVVNGTFVPVPSNFGKHWSVLRLKPKSKCEHFAATLQGFMIMYAFCDKHYETFRQLADKYSVKYLSREASQQFLSGAESSRLVGDSRALSYCQTVAYLSLLETFAFVDDNLF